MHDEGMIVFILLIILFAVWFTSVLDSMSQEHIPIVPEPWDLSDIKEEE